MTNENNDPRVALVTGGAGGIGQGLCRRLAADGFDIGIAYHSSASEAESLARECEQFGVRACPIKTDLADPDEVHAMFETAVAEFGGLNVFVHNAATTVFAKLGRASYEDWRRTFAVNTDSLYYALGEVSKRMADGGRVITISSLSVAACLPGSASYSASKAAVEAITRVAARELGPRGITSNCLQLGLVDTPSARMVMTEASFEPIAQQSNLRRIGMPTDVAGMVSFLAGPDSSWLTAQTIRLDGGFAV
ncbi:SDR family oxidoreductase [Nocardia sp. CA2R105]|uniref:SDR family oxidoreductase n=1 Tax=Nocardia coffeae TaxID=2873381 RepID=UPI001CA5FA3C|nr:SDR family oxidoreductase [Nocardia coffeae]MBY8854964.1 SDR family oxidoreductase [Nocardia coffeae]